MPHIVGLTSFILQANAHKPDRLNRLLGRIDRVVGNVKFVLMTSSPSRDHISRISKPFPKVKFCFKTTAPIESSKVLSFEPWKDITEQFIRDYKGQAPILLVDKPFNENVSQLMDGFTKVQIAATLLGHSMLSTSTPDIDTDGKASKRLVGLSISEWDLGYQKADSVRKVMWKVPLAVKAIADQDLLIATK